MVLNFELKMEKKKKNQNMHWKLDQELSKIKKKNEQKNKANKNC